MEKTLKIDFEEALSQFERAVKKFQLKKIIYRSVFRGKGLEFDNYRNFEKAEDDASMIDWKASLRANKLMAKQYIEERDMNIYFVVDASASMLFGSEKKLKAEYAAEIVVALSHLILNSGDNAGLVMYSSEPKGILLPTKSKNQFNLIIKNLLDTNLYGGRFDFDGLSKFLLGFVKSPAVVIIISDFIGIKRSDEKNFKLIGVKFETMALMVRDALDEKMPDVNYKLYIQDPYSGKQMLVDPRLAAAKYAEITGKQKRFVEIIFNKAGVDLLELPTETSFVLPLASFLRKRAGGIRV